MAERDLVRNASDPEQVRRAAKKERDRAEYFRAALVATLKTAEGRAVIWELLDLAGVYRSIWVPNAEIHYRAGRQDFGHELMALVLAAGEDLYLLMETEARARKRKDNAETDAAHTAPASSEGASNG